ncbi:hypothetical protein BKA93DRAFT_826124 [Sparassis latifolia]
MEIETKENISPLLDATRPSAYYALEAETLDLKGPQAMPESLRPLGQLTNDVGDAEINKKEDISSHLDATRPSAYHALEEEMSEAKPPLRKKARHLVEVAVLPWKAVKRDLERRRLAEREARAARAAQEMEDVKPQVPGVKAEPIDVDLQPLSSEREDEAKYEPMTEEEIKAAPLAKIKRGSQFDYKCVAQRLDAAGLRKSFPIALDETMLKFTMSRYYITELYGGSFVQTFPTISKEMVDMHGVNDFMMLPIVYHPHAPQNPGDPGLFYMQSARVFEWKEVRRVFVALRPGVWSHVGFYKMFPSEPLTADEFQRQDGKVKRTWAEQILLKGWGEDIRLRVWWRQRNDEELSDEEIDVMISDKDIMKTVKEQVKDISAAYERGEEQIGVWCMKCVGYDAKFQRILVNNYDNFIPPSQKNKDRKKKVSAKPKGGKGKAKIPSSEASYSRAASKRKRAQTEAESSDEEATDEDMARQWEDDVEGVDSEIQSVLTVSKGTRSRPQRASRV